MGRSSRTIYGWQMPRTYRSKTFDYSLDYRAIDFRKEPHRYRIGKGEQGVLMVEPYKSELLPLWRFRTPEVARESSAALYRKFLAYKRVKDFVGMDMARKFLQMGYTRARRYANHASGRKYEKNPQLEPTPAEERRARTKVRPQEKDWKTNEKAKAARIFYGAYLKAREDTTYQTLKARHQERQATRGTRGPSG